MFTCKFVEPSVAGLLEKRRPRSLEPWLAVDRASKVAQRNRARKPLTLSLRKKRAVIGRHHIKTP
jgi:hypothetical protein